MSEVLGVWPALPVILRSNLGHPKSNQRWDNLVATLESEHYNRICEIYIDGMSNLRWLRFVAAMQKPFPELTHLHVWVEGDVVPVFRDSFLGGSAPRLQKLSLRRIPLPSMPKLLLSANGLVILELCNIPDSGSISPDTMATALTVMTRLTYLCLSFHFPRSRIDPASRLMPPPTRLFLPALTKLTFKGVYEYLEDLLARIDTPLLSRLTIAFFMDRSFDTPQLHRLIGHAEEFKAFDHASVSISDREIELGLHPKTRIVDHPRLLKLRIDCKGLARQLSSLTQVCSSSFPLISTFEELKIWGDIDLSPSHSHDDMEDARWLELLEPFTALKYLYLTNEIARRVCGALQELPGEMATEVLPALRNIFVDEFWSFEDTQAIRSFNRARQLSACTVAIGYRRRHRSHNGGKCTAERGGLDLCLSVGTFLLLPLFLFRSFCLFSWSTFNREASVSLGVTYVLLFLLVQYGLHTIEN